MGNIINFVISYHYQLRDHFFSESNYTMLDQENGETNKTNENNRKSKHGEFTEYNVDDNKKKERFYKQINC